MLKVLTLSSLTHALAQNIDPGTIEVCAPFEIIINPASPSYYIPALQFLEKKVREQKIEVCPSVYLCGVGREAMSIIGKIFSHENLVNTDTLGFVSCEIDVFLDQCKKKPIKGIRLCSMRVDGKKLATFLSECNSVERCSLDEVILLNDSTTFFGEFISKCTTIKSFSSCNDMLCPFLALNQSIQKLDFNSKLASTIQILKLSTSLRELCVSPISTEPPEVMSSFFSALSKNSNLQKLTLTRTEDFRVESLDGFNGNTTLKAISFKASAKCLQQLSDSENGITDLKVELFSLQGNQGILADFIERATRIQNLSISEEGTADVADYPGKNIFLALSKNPSIRKFSFVYEVTVDAECNSLIAQMIKSGKIHIFRFFEEISGAVFDSLPGNNTLKHLTINVADDVSCHQKSLEKFLRETTTLEVLELKGFTKGTNIASFCHALNENLSIKQLWLPEWSSVKDFFDILCAKNKGKTHILFYLTFPRNCTFERMAINTRKIY